MQENYKVRINYTNPSKADQRKADEAEEKGKKSGKTSILSRTKTENDNFRVIKHGPLNESVD